MMWLYHSTFRTNLRGIKEKGLGAKQSKNWDFSLDGVVYLTSDSDVAFSYCESADEVPDYKYNSGIVVLAIPSNALVKERIDIDRNINDESLSRPHYYIYKGIIDPRYLYVVTSSKGIVGKLLDLKRVPAYE